MHTPLRSGAEDVFLEHQPHQLRALGLEPVVDLAVLGGRRAATRQVLVHLVHLALDRAKGKALEIRVVYAAFIEEAAPRGFLACTGTMTGTSLFVSPSPP